MFRDVVHCVPDQGISPSNRLYDRRFRVQLPPPGYRLQTPQLHYSVLCNVHMKDSVIKDANVTLNLSKNDVRIHFVIYFEFHFSTDFSTRFRDVMAHSHTETATGPFPGMGTYPRNGYSSYLGDRDLSLGTGICFLFCAV